MSASFRDELEKSLRIWRDVICDDFPKTDALQWLRTSRGTTIVASGCSKLSAETLKVFLRRRRMSAEFSAPFAFLSTRRICDVVVLCSAYCAHDHAMRVALRALDIGAKLIVVGANLSIPIRDLASLHRDRIALLQPATPPPTGGFAPVGTSLAQMAVVTHLLLGTDALALEALPEAIYARWQGTLFAAERAYSNVRLVHSLLTDLSLPAATDLETRLLESGTCGHVGHDLIDFCHGRFVLPYAERAQSLIVAYSDREFSHHVNKLLKHFSSDLQVLNLACEYDGLAAMIHHSVAAMMLVDVLSRSRGIDPARPTLPPWADAIYRTSWDAVDDEERAI